MERRRMNRWGLKELLSRGWFRRAASDEIDVPFVAGHEIQGLDEGNGDLGRVPPVRFMDRNPDTEGPRPVHVRARGRVVAKLHGCCEDERVEDLIVPVPQAVRTESRCVESKVAADLTAFAVASWLAATLDDIHVEL